MTASTNHTLIKKVLDKYFDFIKITGTYAFSYMTEFIPELMLDKAKEENDEGYSWWIPINSTITQKEITELEFVFGHPLPTSFKYFLQQRYFLELELGGYGIRFFPNLPGELASVFKRNFNQFSYGDLLQRNYLPFADLSDYGVMCFNANEKATDNEYIIVSFDHEDGYTNPENYAKNFTDMFHEFDAHLDEWIRNWTEKHKGS
jgi:hypothetical protein